jgi:HSP20 family protein
MNWEYPYTRQPYADQPGGAGPLAPGPLQGSVAAASQSALQSGGQNAAGLSRGPTTQSPATGGAPAAQQLAGGGESGGAQQAQAMAPHVDLIETADEFVLLVDAPGFDEDDIDIYADDYSVIVSAQRSLDLDRGERAIRTERPSRLERTIKLPVVVDIGDASASYDNGVCRITVEKTEEDRGRRIGFQ